MKQLMLVGLGGGLGAVARWAIGGWILHQSADWKFPLGTFAVNILGCLVAGVLAEMVTKLDWFTPDTRLFLFTGVMGGFTTFSAFSLETVALMKRGDFAVAFAYVVLSVLVGLAAMWAGMAAVRGSTAE